MQLSFNTDTLCWNSNLRHRNTKTQPQVKTIVWPSEDAPKLLSQWVHLCLALRRAALTCFSVCAVLVERALRLTQDFRLQGSWSQPRTRCCSRAGLAFCRNSSIPQSGRVKKIYIKKKKTVDYTDRFFCFGSFQNTGLNRLINKRLCSDSCWCHEITYHPW